MINPGTRAPDSRLSAGGALYRLAAVEVWERFSYYLLTTLLPLFLAAAPSQGGAGWEPAQALRFYGAFIAGVTIAPFFGGLLSDRWLGTSRALFAGAILMMVGHLVLGVSGAGVTGIFVIGLICVGGGNGLFKPNISVLVGRLPHLSDGARDAAFGTFWMCINIGSLLAAVSGGLVAQRLGWHWAFSMAAAGMALALVLLVLFRRSAITPFATVPARRSVGDEQFSWHFLRPVGLVLAAVSLFGIGYFQMFGMLTLFTETRVDRVIFGFEVPTIWFISLNPLMMIIIMPIITRKWSSGRGTGHDWSTSTKMAAGFASLALAFVIVCGAAVEAQSGAVSPLWIIVAIPLLTLAELLTGPIALAAVSRLAPAPVANVAMGGFSAAVGIGALLSGQIGALAIGDQMLPVSIAIAAAAATISVFLIVQRANLQRLGV